MQNRLECGLTHDEYIDILKQCGMCTKKWTIAKLSAFKKLKEEVIQNRKKKRGK